MEWNHELRVLILALLGTLILAACSATEVLEESVQILEPLQQTQVSEEVTSSTESTVVEVTPANPAPTSEVATEVAVTPANPAPTNEIAAVAVTDNKPRFIYSWASW